MASDELHGSDLLTFGEAAEYAGVSLLDLRERLRGASVSAVWGWRAGSAVHLVTLESLKAIFPALCERRRLPNLSLQERGIEILPEPTPLAKTPMPIDAEPSEQQGKLEQPGAKSEAVSKPHLDDLHGEIQEAAAHNAKLIADLSDAENGLDLILGDVHDPAQKSPHGSWLEPVRDSGPRPVNKIQQWKDLEEQQLQLESTRRNKQRASWSMITILAVVFVAVISLKSKDFLLASSGTRTDAGMPVVDPERPVDINNGAGMKSDAHLLAGSSPLWIVGESAQPLSDEFGLVPFETASGIAPMESALVDMPDIQTEPLAEVDFPESESVTSESVTSESVTSESVTSEAVTNEPTTIEATTILAPLENPDTQAPELVQEPTPEVSSKVKPSHELAALVTSQDAPCLFSKLTAPGNDLRGVLGPCIGPWNEKAQAVSGGFRHSGERYCRHHLIVAKDLGGSVDRARNVARYALQEGLLPPLVRLRVEHGAADLLQTRVGKWVESGFEAGLSGQHEVTAGEEEDQWFINSWVRLQAMPGGKAELKHFSMELQLGADKGRDRWISFEWVQEPQSGE